MVCEHSRLYSRGELGFKFTEDEETNRSIQIKNAKSKKGKRTLILSTVLKLDA